MGPVVKDLPLNAGNMSSIPDPATNIPHVCVGHDSL